MCLSIGRGERHADSTPRIAILGNRVSDLNLVQLEHFTDLGGLLAVAVFDVLLLDMPGAYAGRVLSKLRTLPSYRYRLIYCCRDQDSWCEALGDGACPVEASEITARWEVWQERFSLLRKGPAPERFESRVLAWLWLRDHAQVCALRDPEVPQHYRYPLLEALADSEQINSFAWLALMVQQDWLEEGFWSIASACARTVVRVGSTSLTCVPNARPWTSRASRPCTVSPAGMSARRSLFSRTGCCSAPTA